MFIPPLRNYQNNFSKSSKNYFSNLRNIYSSPFTNNYSGRKPFPDCNKNISSIFLQKVFLFNSNI